MTSRLLVTGATGFLGPYVLRELSRRNYEQIVCLARPSSDTSAIGEAGFTAIQGDLSDADSLRVAMEGVDQLVNLASLGFGHSANILSACEQVGVVRGIFVSTTSIFTRLESRSKAIRLEAERQIGQSKIGYTILRPTMIYGSRRDRNIARLIQYLCRYPILPIFGDGSHLQQPVFVKDVAKAVVDALESPNTNRRTYNIPGAAALTYNELIDVTCETLGRRVFKLHLPVSLSMAAVKLYGLFRDTPALTVEQVLRLSEDKVFDFSKAQDDFGYSPLSFREGIALESRDVTET